MKDTNLLGFLVEFRKRLINCLLLLALIFGVLFHFANDLYTLLALPLINHLPEGQKLIATNILAPFLVPFELTFIVAIFLSVPIFLQQLWSFIAPALYQHERRLIWPLLLMSILLFYFGCAFAYFVIFPVIIHFVVATTPHGVMLNPDISQYLDFAIRLFLIFGIIFEIPLAIVLIIQLNLVTRERLIKMRPYAIVTAFIIGMLLGPPDVLTQSLLALPLWFLFEIGIFLSRFNARKDYVKKSE